MALRTWATDAWASGANALSGATTALRRMFWADPAPQATETPVTFGDFDFDTLDEEVGGEEGRKKRFLLMGIYK